MKKSIVFLLAVMLFMPMAVEADMVDNTSKTWFERGIGLKEKNKHQEAIEAFTKSIEIDPLSVEAYFERGKTSFAHDRTRCLSSLKDLTIVIDLEDDNAEAYYERALVNFYMINNEQGRKDMEKAASLGHKGARDWLNPPQQEKRVTSKVAQVG